MANAKKAPAKKVDKNDPLAALTSAQDGESVWLENLLDSKSVFRDRASDAQPVTMEAHGFVGSIAVMPVEQARNNFLRRAAERGKIRFLTHDEANEIQDTLIFRDETESSSDSNLRALEKGASENFSRYTKEGLEEDATEGTAVKAEEIWKKKGPARTVRRSSMADLADSGENGPVPAEVTETVKEGDWSSDVGPGA